MHTRLISAAAAFLLAGSASARAHLGESEKQLVSKFGRITSRLSDEPSEKTITFERPGVLIIARMVNGKCVSFTETAIGEKFSDGQVKQILEQNAQGKKWSQAKNGGGIWQRSDGAVAYLNPGSVDIVSAPAESTGNPNTNSTPKLNLPAPLPGPMPITAPGITPVNSPTPPQTTLPEAGTSQPVASTPAPANPGTTAPIAPKPQ